MANRFWVGGTGTWDASDTTHWASSSGGAGGQSVPGSSDTVTFDGSSGGGTVTVNTNPTLSTANPSFTMGAFTGTVDFATNNNNISAGGFSISGTGTRTLNMGSGTWTATGTAVVFDATTTTNLTFSGGSATLQLTATTATIRNIIVGSALTIGTLSLGANSGGGEVSISGPASATLTFTNFAATAPIRVIFSGSSTRVYTITNAATLTGSSGSYITIMNTGTFPTINGSITGAYCTVGGITFGTGTQAFTNSWNMGGNSGAGYSLSAPTGGATGVIGG